MSPSIHQGQFHRKRVPPIFISWATSFRLIRLSVCHRKWPPGNNSLCALVSYVYNWRRFRSGKTFFFFAPLQVHTRRKCTEPGSRRRLGSSDDLGSTRAFSDKAFSSRDERQVAGAVERGGTASLESGNLCPFPRTRPTRASVGCFSTPI